MNAGPGFLADQANRSNPFDLSGAFIGKGNPRSWIRITGGRFKNRRIETRSDSGVRPTLGKVREALFNVLGNALEFRDYRFYDLFAGSGIMMLEACGRGLAGGASVEKHPERFKLLKKNFARFPLDNCLPVHDDALDWIERVCLTERKILYLDPPFAENLLERLLNRLERKDWLSDEDFVVVETDSEFQPPPGFILKKKKRYGRVSLHFLQPFAPAVT